MIVAGGVSELDLGTPGSTSSIEGSAAADKLFIVQPPRGFCLERRILNLNSTIRHFDNLKSTIRQSKYYHLDTCYSLLGSKILVLSSELSLQVLILTSSY